jgi:hypothetical protein
MSLLEPFEVNESAQTANLLASPLAEAALSREEIEIFRREITPESVAADVDRYSGKRSIDGAGGVTIKSRHVEHEHNAQAVAALAQELEGIGGDAFSVGLYQFDEIMRERQSGKGSFRKTLNNVEAELAGNESQETVLVTAHLDSTACDPGPLPCRDYDATNEPAPGADDDGSGIAGVLAAARAINRLSAAKRPKRTVRFVLFNAEEVGLVGSREYAQDQAALGKPIVAVYQMDMMGYNKEAPQTYEIHAGADREGVQDGSLVLAHRIEELSHQVSPDLPSPQIHLNKGLAEEDKDPAYRRSDHHSFHLVGYAACAATEDFFPVPLVPGEPVESEGNPNYHTARDTFVDPEYAADIARAVAAAAWVTANL